MITVTVHYFGKCCGPKGQSPWVRRFRSAGMAFAFAIAEEAKVSVRRVDMDPAK